MSFAPGPRGPSRSARTLRRDQGLNVLHRFHPAFGENAARLRRSEASVCWKAPSMIIDEACDLKRKKARQRRRSERNCEADELESKRAGRRARRSRLPCGSPRRRRKACSRGRTKTLSPGPVTDIAAVLDAIARDLWLFRADITLLRAPDLWIVFAHAIHASPKINIPRALPHSERTSAAASQRFWNCSPGWTPRADIVGSTTTASIFRTDIGVTWRPTLLIDGAVSILQLDAQPKLKAVRDLCTSAVDGRRRTHGRDTQRRLAGRRVS